MVGVRRGFVMGHESQKGVNIEIAAVMLCHKSIVPAGVGLVKCPSFRLQGYLLFGWVPRVFVVIAHP